MDNRLTVPSSWLDLRALTEARIALGRAGGSLPTASLLELRLAEARARDAVGAELNVAALSDELKACGFEVLHVHSAARDRATYLHRPDLGRRLRKASVRDVAEAARERAAIDVSFVICDGLSASAIHRHAIPLLALLGDQLAKNRWSVGPVIVVEQGRVAIGDEIGSLMQSEMVAVLIGERPGLSAPDSLSIYFTYGPRPNLTDADRNCISNIRPGGLSYESAAQTLWHLMKAARRLKVSGVRLKDDRSAILATR